MANYQKDAQEYTRRVYKLNLLKDQVDELKKEIKEEDRELGHFAFHKLGMVGWREVDRIRAMDMLEVSDE